MKNDHTFNLGFHFEILNNKINRIEPNSIKLEVNPHIIYYLLFGAFISKCVFENGLQKWAEQFKTELLESVPKKSGNQT